MEDCLDFHGNPLEELIYKSPHEEIYILTKKGDKFTAKNPFQREPIEITPEFSEFLIKISSSRIFTKFAISLLKKIGGDYFNRLTTDWRYTDFMNREDEERYPYFGV